jgi:hypothetical protein
MHKTSTMITKAATIIIYHHGTNFVSLPKVKKVVTLLMMIIKTNTHAENLNKN